MDIKHILKDHAYQNIPLTFEEAYELGVYAWSSCLLWEQSSAQENPAMLQMPHSLRQQGALLCANTAHPQMPMVVGMEVRILSDYAGLMSEHPIQELGDASRN